MAEDNAGGFQAEVLPQLGGGVVAQLMRMPVELLVPGIDLGLVLVAEASLVLFQCFIVALGQRGGRPGPAISLGRTRKDRLHPRQSRTTRPGLQCRRLALLVGLRLDSATPRPPVNIDCSHLPEPELR